ncbi:MAG: hypothetical protein AB7S26_05660 [Sandaracinaceae bacterium]
MTAPAIVVRGATVALCRRTNLRKAFLGEWHPLVAQLWLYALALAQRETGVEIHQSTRVITHHHTDITAPNDRLPDFKRILHGQFSKSLNALLARERYDEPRQLWDDRPTHTMRLLDVEAQVAQLIYSVVNPVAAGLVRSPEEMPGWTFDFGLWKTGPIEVARPDVYYDPKRSEPSLPLVFTAPPLLYRAAGGDLDKLVHHMRRGTEYAVRELRVARKGRPVMGAKAVTRIHPWNEPRTMRESGGQRVPTFKIGASGLTRRTMQIQASLEVRGFRAEYRDARLRRRAGEDVPMPHGTYLMKVQHGAPVAAQHEDALVTADGPTLDDVIAELKTGVQATAMETLVEPVRAAFREEASDIVEDELLDVETPTAARSAGSSRTGEPSAESSEDEKPRKRRRRGKARVRHRFQSPTDEERAGPNAASRTVQLRDRRRGRPRGSDPPA